MTSANWKRCIVSSPAAGSISEPAAIVRSSEIDGRSDRDNARRIDHRVARVIVPLDVREAYRARDSRCLIKITGVSPQVWIIDDAPQVALEVAVVNRVEPDQRCE